MARNGHSLQARLRQRRSSTFVGREQQLELFRQNLTRSLDSQEYYFIFNVYGQGGVGKTTLLKKYTELAKEQKALTAYTDEGVTDIPELLAELARQLKEQDAPLKNFDKQYKTYLQEKKRLEADPDAPKGIWSLIGKTAMKGAITATREFVPGSNMVLDNLVDTDAVASQAGEWAEFVKKKLTNKDEVHLLLEPVETLTPTFLEDLDEYAEQSKICLFLDTFEETGRFLEEWLLQLLEEKFGPAPENLLLIIAGREKLNPNRWSDYGGFMAVIPLEPFTELEAKTYLERKKITDPATIDTIIHLTGKLPVLLVTLAEAAANSPDAFADPCATAVERFLKWIKDPIQRNLALHAALPRQLNQDILKRLLPEDADHAAFFDWLCQRPFVQKRGGHWTYHPVVRDLMLRHLHQRSEEEWEDLHANKLAKYYEKRMKSLGIENRDDRFSDKTWLAYALEYHYHHLMAAPKKELPEAFQAFATVFRLNDFNNAIPWSEIIVQAEKFGDDKSFGNLVKSGLRHLIAKEWESALPLFSKINQNRWLTNAEDSAYFHFVEGTIHGICGRYDNSIKCSIKCIEIKPEFSDAWFILGLAYSALDNKEKAIECYEKVTEINPEDDAAWFNLGHTYSSQGKKEKAMECYQKVIQINPIHHQAWNNLGTVYAALGDMEKAIECYNEAIQIKPDKHETWKNIGNAYFSLGKIEKAIECYEKVTEINPEDDEAWFKLGQAYSSLGKKEKAIECYNEAIQINLDNDSAWYNKGNAFGALGKKEKSIECYEKVIEINPEDDKACLFLGWNYLLQYQLDQAQTHLQKAWEISNHQMGNASMNLGHVHLLQGEQAQAIEWYRTCFPLFEDKEQFFKDMESDYLDLKMEEHGISSKQYQAIIAQLKNEPAK